MLNISHTQTYGPITRSLEFDSGMSIGFSTRTFDSRLKPRPQGGGGQEPERERERGQDWGFSVRGFPHVNFRFRTVLLRDENNIIAGPKLFANFLNFFQLSCARAESGGAISA